MIRSTTRDSLGIFWNGEEVDGILMYSFWRQWKENAPQFPQQLWPPDSELKTRKLFGESWTVWQSEMRLVTWPSCEAWKSVVSNTLQSMRVQGAIIAWCGLEGAFADPPQLFSPSAMSGGVWVCLDQNGTLFGPPALDDDFQPLSDEILRKLHDFIVIEDVSKLYWQAPH